MSRPKNTRAPKRTANAAKAKPSDANASAAAAAGMAAKPPIAGSIFTPEMIQLQRRMRFNPLRTLDPERYSIALDNFDIGILREAAMLWESMTKRDDTLITVKPALENVIASKPWQVLKKKGAAEPEASRHAAALQYFYDNCTAVDAFDRNERGGKFLLLQQMMRAESFKYAVHHFVWKPTPGHTVEVKDAKPVPALTAELEYVPLWYFENTTGTLRFLPFGGYGIEGSPMDFNGEWMCCTGRGIMFAAGITYTFKRLTFQDWTIFNERYAQAKVLGKTGATQESEQGKAMASVVENFNADMGIVLYETQPGEKSPIELIGPNGTVSVDLFERFLDRQDRKMTVMYRGSDLRQMSREKDTTGVSAQTEETEAIELAACRMIASAAHEGIDRQVIRFCFGEGVEPLAYFGLPDMDLEDAKSLRESAGFLADRGGRVKLSSLADRLGVETVGEQEDGSDVLKPLAMPSATGDTKAATKLATENASRTPNSRASGADAPVLGKLLAKARHTFADALNGDMVPLLADIRNVLAADEENFKARAGALEAKLNDPDFCAAIIQAGNSEHALMNILSAACATGLANDWQPGSTGNANDNHDSRGRFATKAGSAVGKEGDWESLGLPSGEDMPAKSGPRPERLSRDEAMQRLATPYAKEDPLGNAVGFGSRLREHFEQHRDGARPEFLPHAEAAVEHPTEIWRDNTEKGPRLRHIAVFHDESGKKHFTVVSHQLGEIKADTITGTPKTRRGVNAHRKGTLLHVSY